MMQLIFEIFKCDLNGLQANLDYNSWYMII